MCIVCNFLYYNIQNFEQYHKITILYPGASTKLATVFYQLKKYVLSDIIYVGT